jgi:hypothetical protein
LRFGSLLLVFGADFAAGYQTEGAHIPAHTVLVDSELAGFQVGNQVAVRIAHNHVHQYFAYGAADDRFRSILRRGVTTNGAYAYSG